MTSYFAPEVTDIPEVAEYPKSILTQQQFLEWVNLLFRSVSR